MSLGHIAGKRLCRGRLANLIERTRHTGSIRRMNGGKVERADNAMGKKHGFGNTAITGGLFHRAEHDRRDRQERCGFTGIWRCQFQPVIARIHDGIHRRAQLDERQKVPQAEPVEWCDIGFAAAYHGKQVTGRTRRVRIQLRRQIGRIADTQKQRHPDGERRVGGNGIASAFKAEALAHQLGIKRRHHQTGAASGVRIHGTGNHRQPGNALFLVERAPDKGPGQRRWLALVTRSCQLHLIACECGAAPELCCLAMVDNPAVQRPPGGDKARIGIEITQPDRRLDRTVGQGVQRGDIDIAMRRIQQHNVKRLEKRGVDRPRVGVIQQICDKRREQRVIDTHGRQNVGSKLGAGGIAHSRAAYHLRLVPEGLEGAADLIHHRAARFLVTTGHQLRLDKPLFPVKPGLFIGKLSDKRFQHLRAATRCHPVEPRGHQRISIVRRAYRRHGPMRNNVVRKGRKGRRGAEHPVIVQ